MRLSGTIAGIVFGLAGSVGFTALLTLHPKWNPLAVELSFATCVLCILVAIAALVMRQRTKMADEQNDGKTRGIVLRGGTYGNRFGRVVMNGVDLPITIEDDAHSNEFGEVNLQFPAKPKTESD